MKESYFQANITLIRDVWSMNRKRFGNQFGFSGHHIAGHERGTAVLISPSMLFDLEDMTGISARRLYYDKIVRSEIPSQPLKRPVVVEPNTLIVNEEAPQYKTSKLTLLERVERLEKKVFS
jgi:hypothetical protein